MSVKLDPVCTNFDPALLPYEYNQRWVKRSQSIPPPPSKFVVAEFDTYGTSPTIAVLDR